MCVCFIFKQQASLNEIVIFELDRIIIDDNFFKHLMQLYIQNSYSKPLVKLKQSLR